MRNRVALKGRREAGSLGLVLEEDERLAPAGADPAERCDPASQVVVPVLDRARPRVAPAGRGYRRRRARFGVGDAERGVSRTEQRVDLVVEPARVAELERHPEPRGDLGEEVGEPVGGFSEVGWELEKDRAELVAERAGGVAEIPEGLVHVADAGEVRGPLPRPPDGGGARKRHRAPRGARKSVG